MAVHKVSLQFGSMSHRHEAVIHSVSHYDGALDLALVRISARSEGKETVNFPCLLPSHGFGDIEGDFTRSVVCAVETMGTSSRTKCVDNVGAERVDDCGAVKECIRITGDVRALPDFTEAAMFVKVDGSRWALAGMNGKRGRSTSDVTFSPIHHAIKWIDDSVLYRP